VPAPWGGLGVNVFLIPGERLTLVDTGPATPEALDALSSALAAEGHRLSDLQQIVVTHAHAGHCGLAGALADGADARVLVHVAGADALADPIEAGRARSARARVAAVRAGAPDEAITALVEALAARAAVVAPVASGRLARLADGTRVRAGGVDWAVLHTPGHSPDHVCLLHAASGAFIAGDLFSRELPTATMLEMLRPQPGGTPARPLALLLASWRRVGRLRLSIAWTGHGEPVRAHRLLIARRLAGLRGRLVGARAALASGASTAWEVAGSLDLQRDGASLAASLAETFALCEWLRDRGQASGGRSGEVMRYQAIAGGRRGP